MTNKITAIKAVDPDRVCKTYAIEGDKLSKTAVANITTGVGYTREVETAQDLIKILEVVTDKPDFALMPGEFHGDNAQPFSIISEGALAKAAGSTVGNVAGGIHIINGKPVAARLKRGITPSHWLLIDADDPEGIPNKWAAMNIQKRLELLEPIVPGLSKCERIELRGSSARVHKEGEEPGQATHAWIKVNDPSKIEVLYTHVKTEMVLQDLCFMSPRHSKETGLPIGRGAERTVVDLSVWTTGRLVFCAKPDVANAPGYICADANITLVNEGAGALDLKKVKLPTKDALARIRAKTGVIYTYAKNGTNISASSLGELTMDTPIEVSGTTQTLAQWAEQIGPDTTQRCEAPFRDSQSEAALIRTFSNKLPLVHDVGNGTTYRVDYLNYLKSTNTPEYVSDGNLDDFEAIGEPSTAVAVCVENAHRALSQPREDLVTDPPNSTGLNGFDARDWAYLTMDNQFVSLVTGEKMGPEPFRTAHRRNTPRVLKYKEVRGLQIAYLDDPSATSFAVDDIGIPVFATSLYAPTMTDDRVVILHGQRMLNSFRLNSVPVIDPNWKDHDGWRQCEAHIRNLIPEGAEEIIKWMGYVVQHTGKKVKWTPIIKGIEGDGKTLISNMVEAAIGQANTRIIGPDEISSEFSGWAHGAALGVLEEIRVSGKNRHAIMNRLKPFITNANVSIVHKGKDGINVPNVMNYMALTNFDDALAITDSDRRWYVAFSKYTEREEMVRDMPPEYFAKLFDFVGNHPEVIRGWLMNVDVTGFNPNFAPESTAAKRVMIENSRSNDEVDVAEAIDLGGTGIGETVLATNYLAQSLRDRFNTRLQTSRMATVMADLGWHKIEHRTKWRGEAVRVYVKDLSVTMMDAAKANAFIREHLDATLTTDFDAAEKPDDAQKEQPYWLDD
jgi:hypothetical protein